MKSSKKALAFALAAAMVVTAVPVAPAEAASTAKLSAKSVTVAAGTAKKQSKTIKVTTPSTWKSVKVSAKSNATGTAKVSVSGKTVKVTAVKKGTAKVTVTVTAKKSGKKVSKKLTATAKVVNAGLKVTAPTEVVVGSETKLTAKVCPSVAKVTYKSSDEAVATVDENGTVKAVKAGDVTITATSDYGKTVEKKIAVKNYVLKDVKQTKIDTLEAVVEGKTSDIKASDFTIKNQTTKVDALVKSVSVDKTDATKITVETFVDMTNGNDIDITLDGVTKSIKATDGNVSSLTVDHVTIPYGAEQKISMVAKDANGVVLLSAPYNSTLPTGYSFSIETNNGYTNGSKLYLNKKDDTATAKITYKTGKYDENGKEVGTIENSVTITAVDPETVTVSTYAVRISSESGKNFDDLKDGTKVAVGDTAFAAIKITDSKNEEIKNYSDYTVETSNKDVLILGSSSIASKSNLVLTPVKEGSAALVIKKDGKTVQALAINVVSARKPGTLSLDKTSFTMAKVSNTESAKITVKDQYGDDIKKANYNTKVELLTEIKEGVTAPTTTPATGATAASGCEKVDFTTSNSTTTGTYTYKVTVTGGDATLAKTVTVNVKDVPNTDASYLLKIDENTKDAAVKSTDDTNKTVPVKVVEMKGGLYVADAAGWNIKVLDKDNKDAKLSDGTTSAYESGKIVVTKKDTNSNVVAKLAAGNYKIQAENGGKKITSNFVVTDSQPTVSVKRNKTAYSLGDSEDEKAVVKGCFEFTYDRKKCVSSKPDESKEIEYAVTNVTLNTQMPTSVGTKDVSIKDATIQITVASNTKIEVKVPIGATVSVTK